MHERPGPGFVGMAGILLLGFAVGAVVVMMPLPTPVWVALVGAGVCLTGFAAWRSWRASA